MTIRRYFGLIVAAGVLAVAVGGEAVAKQGGNGWQATDGETIPTGSSFYEFIRPCPSGFAVQNGGYSVLNGVTYSNGFTLVSSGPDFTQSPPDYSKWLFVFSWPNGGSPSGAQIVTAASCKKGRP
ncbi:MAG TPA: hypothetical protein VGF97_05010 [Rhizomicrobium sp.]